MTQREQEVRRIIKQNGERVEYLLADYNPVTGEGAPGDRILLKIPDFAIPEQWVPKEMMNNTLVKKILNAGSIENFLKWYPEDPIVKTPHDVELCLRRIRHRYDFCFWAFFCFPILAKEGGEIRFKLNRPQIEVEKEAERLRLENMPIDLIIVKARQWGGSTYSMAKQMWIMMELDNYHSFAVAAHVNGAAENILRMMKNAINKYPAWDLGLAENERLSLVPAGRSGNAYVIKDSRGNQVIPATIYIGSVQNPDSLRSGALSGALYSEVGVWQNTPERRPEDLVASISGAILKRPLTMQVIESTAKSSDDYLHTVWREAKEGHSSYVPIFISWMFIPHDTIPVEDYEEFVNWLLDHKDDDRPSGRWKDSGRHYWWLWQQGATLEGINWYRYKRLDYTTYAQMANEAPSNDIEAFQAAGTHVFDIYEVAAMREKFRRDPVYRGRLLSNDRRDRGVLENIRFIEQSNGDLDIWEMPDAESEISNRYLVAVDIGGPNPTSDYHSVRVFDRFLMMDGYDGIPAVVANMHYHCQRDQLVFDAVRLAAWYNNALLVIESNTLEMADPNRQTSGDGSQYVLDLAAEIYPHMYARESSPETIIEGMPRKWGFRTDHQTKPKIIDLARWAIHEQAWNEPSVNCLDEFAAYIEDKNKFTAPAKKHDDDLMATCIGLWVCYREMPLPAWIVHDTVKVRRATELNAATF